MFSSVSVGQEGTKGGDSGVYKAAIGHRVHRLSQLAYISIDLNTYAIYLY